MKKKTVRQIGMVASILMAVGAINWGLVGVFDFNLVELLFGWAGWLETTVYGLVGASGIIGIWTLFVK